MMLQFVTVIKYNKYEFSRYFEALSQKKNRQATFSFVVFAVHLSHVLFAWSILNTLAWKLIVGTFVDNCRRVLIIVKVEQKYQKLKLETYVQCIYMYDHFCY